MKDNIDIKIIESSGGKCRLIDQPDRSDTVSNESWQKESLKKVTFWYTTGLRK